MTPTDVAIVVGIFAAWLVAFFSIPVLMGRFENWTIVARHYFFTGQKQRITLAMFLIMVLFMKISQRQADMTSFQKITDIMETFLMLILGISFLFLYFQFAVTFAMRYIVKKNLAWVYPDSIARLRDKDMGVSNLLLASLMKYSNELEAWEDYLKHWGWLQTFFSRILLRPRLVDEMRNRVAEEKARLIQPEFQPEGA